MRYDQVVIESFASALPEERVTSVELEQRLAPVYERFGLHVGRLELMTGIRERRFWPPGEPPSTGSVRAGRAALAAGGLTAADLDVLLHTAVSRDFLEPATAAVVHHALGLPDHAPFFDISNACLGFINGMFTLANMIELGQVRRGLVVAGESGRQLVESTIAALNAATDLTRRQLKQAFASLTIGSGAVAMVLAHRDTAPAGHRLCGGVIGAATRHSDLCQGSGDTGFTGGAGMLMQTDAEALLEAGCALAARTWPRFREHLGWDGVERCFTHQVGVAHRERLYEILQRDPAKDTATLETLGNVGSVSLPLTCAVGLTERPPRSGERLALLGIGSGLSCAMLGIVTQ